MRCIDAIRLSLPLRIDTMAFQSYAEVISVDTLETSSEPASQKRPSITELAKYGIRIFAFILYDFFSGCRKRHPSMSDQISFAK